MVGILYLTRDIRKRLNITIAAAYLQLSDEQKQLNISFDQAGHPPIGEYGALRSA
jgi:predicted metal-dependent RNase